MTDTILASDTMIDRVLAYTLPAAYAVLPPAMASREASALLLAIGLQESRFVHRRQITGPARGWWQFERGGIIGVLTHPSTVGIIGEALTALGYPPPPRSRRTSVGLGLVLEHNDTVAAVFARLLLWTLPDRLPDADQGDEAWQQYVRAWRPGKPHPAVWAAHYAEAWARVAP